jgi:glycosyltransferase involved in cell wall biosynthesis
MNRDLSIVAIIALYNGAPYIEEAIRSVLDQTLAPDEFIVVDDGSTDDGPAIVRRLAETHPQIRLLSKPNGGQSSARNFGVAHSKSALIALLDQDDGWYPTHLARLVEPFRDYDGGVPLGWVYSDLDRVDADGNLLIRNLLQAAPGEHPKRTLAGCLAEDMTILPSAALIAREAFEHVGGFDEALSGYEDDDLFLRLFRSGYHNIFVEQPLSKWRNDPGSTSYSPRMARSREIYLAKLIATFPDDPATGYYFTRDLIAPRFVKTYLYRYIMALQADDAAAMKEARDGIAALTPHLEVSRALQVRALRAIMAAPPAARAAVTAWRFAKPLLGRSRAA